MSTVLAIDTSTSQTCVALVENGKVLFNKSHLDPLAHGEVLPKLVAQALKLTAKVDLVAVGMGPGPFTGLRVGITFAQSYALAAGALARLLVCELELHSRKVTHSVPVLIGQAFAL